MHADGQAERLVLNPIAYEPDIPALRRASRVRPAEQESFDALILEGAQLARPKAVCTLAYIQDRNDNHVRIDDHWFRSRVLRVNLEPVQRVFAYVVTAGAEVAQWAAGISDLLQQYWADGLQQDVLKTARGILKGQLQMRYQPGLLSSMSPGSLEDWPLAEQRPLFQLIGDVQTCIGVKLTESMLMQPTKSVSGFYFETESQFSSCQLCPRQVCSHRKAPYDPSLYARRYAG